MLRLLRQLNCYSSFGIRSAIPEEAGVDKRSLGSCRKYRSKESGGYTEDCFSSRAAAAVLVTEAKALPGRKKTYVEDHFDGKQRSIGSGVITVGWVSDPNCSGLGNRSEEPE